jgi:hypothetical protein
MRHTLFLLIVLLLAPSAILRAADLSRVKNATRDLGSQGRGVITQFDEALKTPERADMPNLQGVWKVNILKSIEAVNQARKSR